MTVFEQENTMSTRTALNEKMDLLREEIGRMAALVEENLAKAAALLKQEDPALAEEVKQADVHVDALQLKIEDETAILIATESPVARDLREMVSVFKLTSNLERVGDYAIHLARGAVKIKDSPAFRFIDRLETMAAIGGEMIRESIAAYRNQDAEAARKAAALDDNMDRVHRELTEEVLRFMKKEPAFIKKALRVITVSGFLERLGDHVTNICETVIYMVESKHEELN
jgi:phosphate transport system protein